MVAMRVVAVIIGEQHFIGNMCSIFSALESPFHNLESKTKFIRCKAIVHHILLHQKLLRAERPQHLGWRRIL